MKTFSLTARALFFLLSPFFFLTLLTGEAAYSQSSDPIDPSHNFPAQSQPDDQRPSDDVSDPRQDQQDREETRREQSARKAPPIEREGDRTRQEEQERRERDRLEEKERQKERAQEAKRRRQEKEDRLKEERERKAAERRDRIQKIRERTQRRVEQQRQKQLFQPDLVADNLEVLPHAVIQHQTVTLVAFVRNASEEQTRNIPIHFYLDKKPITEKVINLKAGEARAVEITVPMAIPGSQTVTVKIDPNNKIAEKTKRNNNQTRTVEVAPAPHEDERFEPSPQLGKNKQLKPRRTLPATEQGLQVDPHPAALGTMKKQPAKPELPDKSILMNKGNIVDLIVNVHQNKGIVSGDGKDVKVTVKNVGKLPAIKLFTVGLYRHEHIKASDEDKHLGQFSINGLGVNKSQTVTIPWTANSKLPQKQLPQTGVNYVAIVDSHYKIDEGGGYGEKNNISMPFKYFVAKISPSPQPAHVVDISNLYTKPIWVAKNEWYWLKADVTGEDYWEMYYDYLDSTMNAKKSVFILGGVGQFPTNGLKLPSPFNVAPPGLQDFNKIERIRIRLTAKNTVLGGIDTDNTIIAKGLPLDGTLSIIDHSYDWDPTEEKVTKVTLTIQANTNSPFQIDGSGHSDFGSLWLYASIVNKRYDYVDPQKSTKKATTHIIVSAETYRSPYGKGAGKYLYFDKLKYSPQNGKAIFKVYFKPTCSTKVAGYNKYESYSKGFGQGGGLKQTPDYPSIDIFLYYSTTSGSKVLSYFIPVTKAWLYPVPK